MTLWSFSLDFHSLYFLCFRIWSSPAVAEDPRTISNWSESQNSVSSYLPCSLFFVKYLLSILVATVEKNISLNLIKVILKVGVIWKTCSRSLKLNWCCCLIRRIDRGSLSEVRKARFYLKLRFMLKYLNVWVMWSPISKLLCINCFCMNMNCFDLESEFDEFARYMLL